MKVEYSLNSVRFIKFIECIEKISKLIRYDSIKIYFDYHTYGKLDLELFKEINEDKFPVTINFTKSQSLSTIKFDIYWKIFRVKIEGFSDSVSNDLQHIVESTLEISPPTKEDLRGYSSLSHIMTGVWSIIDKLDEISKLDKKSADELTMNCFLSFRFDEHNKSLAF